MVAVRSAATRYMYAVLGLRVILRCCCCLLQLLLASSSLCALLRLQIRCMYVLVSLQRAVAVFVLAFGFVDSECETRTDQSLRDAVMQGRRKVLV
jgi:hypothetical protein